MPTIAMVRKAPLDDYVVETLMPDLIGHDRSPSAFIVYVKLWHGAGGADGRVQASLSTPGGAPAAAQARLYRDETERPDRGAGAHGQRAVAGRGLARRAPAPDARLTCR